MLDKRVFKLVAFSIYEAFLSTILSLIFGILIALSFHHIKKFPFRDITLSFISTTLVLPSIVVVLGIITVFGRNGWINTILHSAFGIDAESYLYGLFGILIAHIYFNASYSSRVFLNALNSIPQSRYKLSKTLGLNFLQRFFYIELWELKPYIYSLSGVIFLLCFSSFIIVLTLGGSPSYNTLEVAIYEALRFDFNIALAIKLSLIQVGIAFFILILSPKDVNISNITNPSNYHSDWLISKNERLFYKVTIVIFSTLFFLPIFAIFLDGIKGDFIKLFREDIFIRSFIISFVIAFLSSFLSMLFSLSLSFAKANFNTHRVNNPFFSKLITVSSSIYLMISSMVLALGFFLFSRHFQIPTNISAFIALISGNILLSLPFCNSALYPKIEKLFISYDKLSDTLGIKLKDKILYLYLPHLKSEVLYVATLSFCFSLGDLSIIALFGDNNITTLPWYLYQKMGSYQNSDANAIALILLLIIFCLFFISQKVKNVTH